MTMTATNETHRITWKGRELLRGDQPTIAVVFNNLAGRNLRGKLYFMYLDYVRRKLGADFEPQELEMSTI
jgi:hypothetical protein